MACLEKIRLQQHYDVALRRWHQVDASTQLYGQTTYMTFAVREQALAERKAAKARLTIHRQNCKKCRAPNLYPAD
jgi:hypothetical protein